MFSGSMRIRLAMLYGGVFLVLALVMLAIPFVSVSETQHFGSSGLEAEQLPPGVMRGLGTGDEAAAL